MLKRQWERKGMINMKRASKVLLCDLLIFLLILTGCASENENDTVESIDTDKSVQMSEEEQNELPDQTATGQELSDNKDMTDQNDYTLDLSGLSEDVISQLEVFAENKDFWNMNYYGQINCCYAVFDLDNDGRLELITSTVAGNGLFYSENHFYRTDDTFTKIEELKQEYYEEYHEYYETNPNELDLLCEYEGLAYTDGEVIYYPAEDEIGNGAVSSYIADGAYYVKDGIVYSVIYRGCNTLWGDEDNNEQTWYDAAGNEITQEAWEKLYNDFYAGMEPITYHICWESLLPSELEQASEQEILCVLVESYKEGIQ